MQVGDYGTINRQSGEFEKEGNVYDDALTAEIVMDQPPQTTTKDTIFEIASNNVKRVEFELGPTV